MKDLRMVIDTREQLPYQFKNAVVKTLKLGDYAPLGYENEIAIERKSLADWASSITKGRARLEREILRAKKELKFFAIIIETDLDKIWKAPLYSQINRKALVNVIPRWMVKYNIPILFGSNRVKSKYLVRELCEAYADYKTSDKYREVFGS